MDNTVYCLCPIKKKKMMIMMKMKRMSQISKMKQKLQSKYNTELRINVNL
uniref:Hypotheticial protein n=1 Tax=Schistosoma japonicum TaxID=6182 RepID=C1LNM4_SCHJA|nr:hypotheticial protein [Schistosoma japonicum]